MAKIRRRSIPIDRRAMELTQLKRLGRRPRAILFLLLFLGLFALSFNRVLAYEENITRKSFTIQGALPVPVLEMQPAHRTTNLVAVVAHGFAGSKDLMTGFGVELARAGITAYLFDFPGHGESPVSLPDSNTEQGNNKINIAALSEVVNYTRTARGQHPDLILIGHSMGSVAVGDYSLQHGTDNDIISTILISPVGLEQPTGTQPRNLLMLTGQNDIPFAITDSQRMLRLGCGSSAIQSSECGNVASGTGRRAIEFPNVNHITILNADSTFQEILTWLHQVNPQAVDTMHMQSNLRLFWFLFGVIVILLAMFPLCSLSVDLFTINVPSRAFRGQDIIFFDLCLFIGIALAIVLQRQWRPFSFVHTLLADYVSGYFFFTALITAFLIFVVRRMLPLPLLWQTLKQILIGVLLAIFLYFTFGQLLTFAWERLTFTLPRFWHFFIIFVLLTPLFLLDAGIHGGCQESGVILAIVANLLFKALLIAGLFVALYTTPGLNFLSIVLPLLALLFVLLTGFSVQLYTSGRATLTVAILSALVIAWVMSTTVPIT